MADIPVFQYQPTRILPTASPVGSLMDLVNASSQGSQIGLKVPSTSGAIAQGVTDAYNTYQTGELRQAQIEGAQLNNQIARRQEADIAAVDPGVRAETAQIEASNKLADAKKQQMLGEQYAELASIQQAGDPQAYANAVLSGRYAQLFAAAPKIGEQATRDTYAYWPSDRQEAYLDVVKSRDRQGALDRFTQTAAQNFQVSESAFTTDDTTSAILALKKGLTADDLRRDGSLVLDETDRYLKDPSTGEILQQNPSWKPNNYLFKYKDEVVPVTVGKDFIKSFKDYRSDYDLLNKRMVGQNGLGDMQKEAAQISAAKASGAASNAAAGGVPDPSGKQPQAVPGAAPTATATPVATPGVVGNSVLDRLAARKAEIAKKVNPENSTSNNPPVNPNVSNSAIGNVQASENLKHPVVAKYPFLAGAPPAVLGVISVESSGDANAVSPKGARSLMQVIPSTFDYVTKKYRLEGLNPDRPEDNVTVGSIYLAEQVKTFGSQFGNGFELALAAYNTGPGRVSDALKQAKVKSWDGVKAELKEMLSPAAYAEVSAYPDKVKRAMLAQQKAENA